MLVQKVHSIWVKSISGFCAALGKPFMMDDIWERGSEDDLSAATQLASTSRYPACTASVSRKIGSQRDSLGPNQASIHDHLLKMPALANLINSDLSRGFTVAQVAEKHNWTDKRRLRKGAFFKGLVS